MLCQYQQAVSEQGPVLSGLIIFTVLVTRRLLPSAKPKPPVTMTVATEKMLGSSVATVRKLLSKMFIAQRHVL